MNVGIGLPNTKHDITGEIMVTWARKADEGPFTSLGVLDRMVYQSTEPLMTLAAVAGVTQRVRLAATIIAAPLRNTVLLAKQAATLDLLSGGRLVLGVALGARREDYEAVGAQYRGRARRFNEQLLTLRTFWEDHTAVGPRPVQSGGPPLLVGGMSDQTFARVARYADGYIHGGGPPRAFARAAQRARAAWEDAGRPGTPMLWGMAYFAFGKEAVEASRQYLLDYYAFTGPFARRIAEGLLTTPQAVRQFIRGYADAGCDELILFPGVSDPEQLDRLADILEG
ncbi:MAG: LLM class flavin-dependent oxidoreductase [Ardenticatenia bacterium]|nr:LLM class flavin-dependent oxidoreductase [Ardenticatenia bacterium]